MPEQSNEFIQNKACAYFPCHKTNDVENFNCLFCYCPLYFLEECGGNKKDFNGIKDCSDCLVPHGKNGYETINRKIREENQRRKEAKKAESTDGQE